MINVGRRRFKNRLVLCEYFYNLFGQETFHDFRKRLRGQEEGFGSDGHSNFFHTLKGLSGLKISELKLREYDLHIKEYVERINKHREEPIRLKYFQYLAVLFSEIYLDKYFNEREDLLNSLNEFIKKRNKELPEDERVLEFRKEDLRKIAYWMATGSGKTFIMHINFWQFLRYNDEELDNILLITPNEGLTKQHIEEMEKNGINAVPFRKNSPRQYSEKKSLVEVIDLYKLEEESGEKTVSVEALRGNNLVLVDEGHRGMSGDIWLEHRKAIASNGFVFEYSATFGQALAKTRDIELRNEYFKSILLDYSYRHFYEDGYGKDYRIMNLKEDISEKLTNRLLLANLLSLYEQKLCYDENEDELEEYNLKPPLWAFFGGKVNAVYTREGEETSDVLTVVEFLHDFLNNPGGKYFEEIEKVLSGNSELKDREGREVFENRFRYLQKRELSSREIYKDILERIFHTAPSDLELVNLKETEGEIGLKARNSDAYFGVINIGDENKFLRLAEDKAEEIGQREDRFRGSLFDEIKKSSKVNILIGSKKFLQGWSSWRVSNIGLMNLGRKRGPEIIQLFGRGVRLKGKNKSLKRSTALEEEHPPYISILETLNIFGIKADYMTKFREYLEKEGIEVSFVEHKIPIKVEEEFLNKNLKIPRVKKGKEFKEEVNVYLEADENLRPSVDLRPRIEIVESLERHGGERVREAQKEIGQDLLPLVNWDKVYFDMLEYKKQKGYCNLHIDKGTLKEIVRKGLYQLYCSEEKVSPEEFDDIIRVERTIIAILRSYIDAFYSNREGEWKNKNIEYKTLEKSDENLKFGSYNLKVPRSKEKLLSDIEELLKKKEKLYEEELDGLNVYFDRHIYQPLLFKYHEDIKIEPSGSSLNVGEKKFVEDLKEHLIKNKETGPLKESEIYLLRNLRNRGISFYEAGNFHPDFILWIKKEEKQHIFFIDPHGLIHSMHLDDPKIVLSEKIKELEKSLGRKNISLESFIVSVTKFDEISTESSKEKYEERNVFFQEDKDYISKILEKVDSSPS